MSLRSLPHPVSQFKAQILVSFLGLGLLAVAAYCVHEPPLIRAQRAIGEAVTAYRSGSFARAEASYLEAVALDPGNKVAEFNLGVLAQRKGDQQEAERRYRLAIKTDPRFVPALYNLGALKEATGDYEEAAQLYRRVVNLNPRLVAARLRLGLVLTHRLSRESEGKAELEKAVQLDPRLQTQISDELGLQAPNDPSRVP